MNLLVHPRLVYVHDNLRLALQAPGMVVAVALKAEPQSKITRCSTIQLCATFALSGTQALTSKPTRLLLLMNKQGALPSHLQKNPRMTLTSSKSEPKTTCKFEGKRALTQVPPSRC